MALPVGGDGGLNQSVGAPSDVTLQLSNEARERSDLVDLLDQHWEERTRELRRRRREDHVEGEEGKEKER